MNQVRLLPLTEDILKLTHGMAEAADKCCAVLSDGYLSQKQNAWVELCEVTLGSIVVFNRKRSGEVAKMTTSSLEKRQKANGQKLISQCLTPLEQELSSKLERVVIVGKRGNPVPILLTEKMTYWLSMLVRFRSLVEPQSNFLFPSCSYGGEGHIQTHNVLKKWSEAVGAEQPALLRTKGLRMQIATVAQVANLTENEMDIFAKFLGHDIRVHREFYRLPDEVLQVAKVSKLLFAVNSGNSIQGGLDDITVTSDDGIV